MIRVVLDTNVLAPGFSTKIRTTSAAILLDMWARQVYELVVSERLLAELTNTLAEPYFAKRFSLDEVGEILARLRLQAFTTELTRLVSGVATQPADDLVLSTGLSA